MGGAAQIPAMKKTAGSLRLDLAQYRELQAFAQFGSDLDKGTQAKLTRGERLVEILKQPQYQPLEATQQVMLIHAGTSGALDDVPTGKLGEFQKLYLEMVTDANPEVSGLIRESKKAIPDEAKAILDKAIAAVKAQL